MVICPFSSFASYCKLHWMPILNGWWNDNLSWVSHSFPMKFGICRLKPIENPMSWNPQEVPTRSRQIPWNSNEVPWSHMKSTSSPVESTEIPMESRQNRYESHKITVKSWCFNLHFHPWYPGDPNYQIVAQWYPIKMVQNARQFHEIPCEIFFESPFVGDKPSHFPYVVNVIIPTDEVIFFRGL